MKQNRLLTDASQLFCQNEACPARGQGGAKTIIRYGQKRERYHWKVRQKTFSARQGTMFEELRKPVELIVIVVTRLSYGCPLQAMFTLLTVTPEPSLEGLSKPETLSRILVPTTCRIASVIGSSSPA